MARQCLAPRHRGSLPTSSHSAATVHERHRSPIPRTAPRRRRLRPHDRAPSRTSSESPRSANSFDSIETSLRPTASRSPARIAETCGFAVTVITPFNCGASRSRTARALARSAASVFLVVSSANLRRAGPGGVPIASSREVSAGASGATSAVICASEAAPAFSVNLPVASARSKLPDPSIVTPPAWPKFNRSSEKVFGV